MGKIKGILKKAINGIKDSFTKTLEELKEFIKTYKRLSAEQKRKEAAEKNKEKSTMSKEDIERVKNIYNEFKEKLAKETKVSKLDPKNYHSIDELYLGILEDMGLNEKFKNNPIAKEELTDLFEYILKDMAKENPEIEVYLRKRLVDFTEQDVSFLKEKLKENQKLKIDEQRNLKYVENIKGENEFVLDADAYDAVYLRREFRIQGNDYEQEIIEKECTMVHDEDENEYIGKVVSTSAHKYRYNQYGIEMAKERHEAKTEYTDDIKGEEVWTYVNGDDQDVGSISELENVFSSALERYDVMGVCYGYQDKTEEPHKKGLIKTMNDSEDITYLKIDIEKVMAIQDNYTQRVEEYEKEMQLSDEDKKKILKEKIEKSSRKEALTKMAQKEKILDEEEERT